jgi:DNA-directed RNA polymerase
MGNKENRMTHIYLDPVCENQLDLEVQMLDLGKERFRARLAKERDRGQMASTGATSRIVDNLYQPVAENITAWLKDIAENGKGRWPQAYKPLSEVEPELAAYIGVRVIFDLIMGRGGCPEHRAAASIGSWVEHECRVKAFATKHKRLLDHVMKKKKQHTNNLATIRAVVVHTMENKDDKWNHWSHQMKVAVGYVVIQCLLVWSTTSPSQSAPWNGSSRPPTSWRRPNLWSFPVSRSPCRGPLRTMEGITPNR